MLESVSLTKSLHYHFNRKVDRLSMSAEHSVWCKTKPLARDVDARIIEILTLQAAFSALVT